jgi:hypothetical protein
MLLGENMKMEQKDMPDLDNMRILTFNQRNSRYTNDITHIIMFVWERDDTGYDKIVNIRRYYPS